MIVCIYCKIVKKELPSIVFFESEDILAFNDIHPIAPVHVLIIPKRHIENINKLEENDAEMMGRMILVAKQIALELDIAEKGYKLLFRVGHDGGQEVPHIHLHLIGGAKMHEDIHPIG